MKANQTSKNPKRKAAGEPKVRSSALLAALVETVNRYRYRGMHGNQPMHDEYRWPLSVGETDNIAAAALRFVIAQEQAANVKLTDRRENP